MFAPILNFLSAVVQIWTNTKIYLVSTARKGETQPNQYYDIILP